MKVLVNFANLKFRASQDSNSTSGLEVGGFDSVMSYGPGDIDADFARGHRRILQQRKGAGLWLWKPYFVAQTLKQLDDGDFLFYCDAGARFLEPVDSLIQIALRDMQDVLPFELSLVESEWTKRDAFILLDCDFERYSSTKQRLASFFLLRKSKLSEQFIADYLRYSTDARALSDDANELGLPNYPGFREHRHDQSVFSLLTKRYGFNAYRDPSQWGNAHLNDYPTSNYGQIIEHTRQRTGSLFRRLSYAISHPRNSGNVRIGRNDAP